jgi:hypothetical protein
MALLLFGGPHSSQGNWLGLRCSWLLFYLYCCTLRTFATEAAGKLAAIIRVNLGVVLGRMFLDLPIGRASCLDVSRLFVPAVAVMVPAVQPAKFWLHLEARQSRAGPDECLPLLSNFSLDYAPLRADDTGPPGSISAPPVLLQTGPRLKLQGPPGPPAALQRGTLPSEPAKTRAPARIGVLQRVIFTTGFS